MKSNEPQTAYIWNRTATVLGALGWVLGFFALYMVLYNGLFAIFVVFSAILLAIYIKMKSMGEGVPGAPKKIYITIGILCFALQVLFFGALTILGMEAMPWAEKIFFTVTALYLLAPFATVMSRW